MKRSEIRRKTPLKAASELNRKPMKRRPKRKATTDKRWRSAEYIAWVKQRPCAFCALGPCDPHHVIGLGWALSGMGLTAPDSFAIPLCRAHHDAVHAEPALQRMQPLWLRWTLKSGMQEFGGETREELARALEFVEAKMGVMA